MALVVNSNIASINAQRQLSSSGMALDKASERLASGQRINSAADDAAGLAISNRQTSQIRGLEQAIRNANDGVSLIQTAEGALDESTNILQRMRELAVQSANGIYSDTDRATLDAEVQQLVGELDRIAETTSFNGQNILDGSMGEVKLQVGSQADQTIGFSIEAMDTSSLGLGSTTSDLSSDTVGGTAGGEITLGDGDILINGQGLSSYTNTAENENLQTLIDDINDNITGVTASGFNVAEATSTGTGVMNATDTLTIELHDVNGGSSTTYTLDALDTDSLDDLATAITSATGGNVTASVGDDGKLALSNTTGGTLTVTADANTQAATGFGAGPTEYFGSLALSSDDGSDITVSLGANGTSAQLSALGFNEISGPGEVTGSALGTAAQNGALVAGDVKINGVDIGAVDANDGLQAKVDAINAVSDDTGVTATTVAQSSFTFEGDTLTATQIQGTNTSSTLTTGGAITLNGFDVTLTAADDWAAVAADINAAAASTGVTAYVDDDGELNLYSEGAITLDDGTTSFAAEAGIAEATVAAAAVATGDIKINNNNISFTDLTDLDQVVTEINNSSATTGVRAAVDENGELELTGSSTIQISLGEANGAEAAAALGITFAANNENTDDNYNDTLVVDPRIALDSANGAAISVEVTTNGAADTGLKNLNTDLSSTVTGSALANISIGTLAGANSAIGSIDQALETINDTRSELGAVNNRLDFTVSNLSNVVEKTSAARSRIMDADFAAESAALSKAQVLQQASQSMLAQANARPQQVLSLLQ